MGLAVTTPAVTPLRLYLQYMEVRGRDRGKEGKGDICISWCNLACIWRGCCLCELVTPTSYDVSGSFRRGSFGNSIGVREGIARRGLGMKEWEKG